MGRRSNTCALDDLELGEARAKVLRHAGALARMRGVSRDHVLSCVMRTNAYKRIGEPKFQDLSLEQAEALSGLLEHWMAQADKTTPKAARAPSTAPPASWHEGTNHQTEEGNDQ